MERIAHAFGIISWCMLASFALGNTITNVNQVDAQPSNTKKDHLRYVHFTLNQTNTYCNRMKIFTFCFYESEAVIFCARNLQKACDFKFKNQYINLNQLNATILQNLYDTIRIHKKNNDIKKQYFIQFLDNRIIEKSFVCIEDAIRLSIVLLNITLDNENFLYTTMPICNDLNNDEKQNWKNLNDSVLRILYVALLHCDNFTNDDEALTYKQYLTNIAEYDVPGCDDSTFMNKCIVNNVHITDFCSTLKTLTCVQDSTDILVIHLYYFFQIRRLYTKVAEKINCLQDKIDQNQITCGILSINSYCESINRKKYCNNYAENHTLKNNFCQSNLNKCVREILFLRCQLEENVSIQNCENYPDTHTLENHHPCQNDSCQCTREYFFLQCQSQKEIIEQCKINLFEACAFEDTNFSDEPLQFFYTPDKTIEKLYEIISEMSKFM